MGKHGGGQPSFLDGVVQRVNTPYVRQLGEMVGMSFLSSAWAAFQASGGHWDRATVGMAAGAGWAAGYGLLVKNFGAKGRPTYN